ncbi:MAG: FkbM family methyltransferase [Acidobacteriota bacterium]
MPDSGRGALDESLERLALCRSRIGSLPPQPRTLRGAVGMLGVKLVRRLLFWFIRQVEEFCEASIAVAEQQASIAPRRSEDFFRWRLAERLEPRPRAIAAGDIVATEIEGFILGIPASEWRMAAYYTFRGHLEPGLVRYLERTVAPGAVFVDAGANIGIVTLVAARLAGPRGKVYSFEPAPHTFAILKDNIQVNGFLESGRIDFRELALADRTGEAPFFVYAADSGHNTLFAGGGPADRIQVKTAALDDVLAPGTRVDAIKIDAEGAEPLIWRGMRRVLADNPDVTVILEFDPGHLARAGSGAAAFLDEIEEAGFAVSRIEEPSGELRPAPREALLAGGTVNLVARRNGRR